MPRFITPPDMVLDPSIPKVLVRNCMWDEEQTKAILLQLSDKPYDIYLYNDSMNDVQWFEGLRGIVNKVIDCSHVKDGDYVSWLRKLDDEF